jgi:hypothetical protein
LTPINRLVGRTSLASSYSPDVDNDLPFIDEHRVLVSAPAHAVWRSLIVRMARPRRASAEVLAHLLATEPRRASARPFGEGATLPGFKVAEAVPERRIRLTGRHRFSRYALILTLVTQPDGTMLSARTHAEFPGLRGWVYRRLVIGSGAHRVFVARLLRAVRRQAEGQSVR